MAEYFEIKGGKKLFGSIDVRGSKNATTPLLAATLLTNEPCTISNIPLIEDVFRMLEIISGLGASVDWIGERKVKICAKNIDPKRLTASGRSQFLPVDDHNTTDARQKNRRTEIILTPDLTELYNLINKY